MPPTPKCGPTYDDATTICTAPRTKSVDDVALSNEQYQKISQRTHIVSTSRLTKGVGIAFSTDDSQPALLAHQDVEDKPHERAEHHSPVVLDYHQQQAKRLRSHPILKGNTKRRIPREQIKSKPTPLHSDQIHGTHAIESQVVPVKRADSPVETLSSEDVASSAEHEDRKMVNKATVVLNPTPPPALRDDELFLATDSPPQAQRTWPHVPVHSTQVSGAADLVCPISAEVVGADQKQAEEDMSTGETAKDSGLQPLVLHLPIGPSLHEEIFDPFPEEGSTRSDGGSNEDSLEEYTKYMGWVVDK